MILQSNLRDFFGDGATYHRASNINISISGWLVRSESAPATRWLRELQAETQVFEILQLRRLENCSEYLVDRYGQDALELMERWRKSLVPKNIEYYSHLADFVLFCAGISGNYGGRGGGGGGGRGFRRQLRSLKNETLFRNDNLWMKYTARNEPIVKYLKHHLFIKDRCLDDNQFTWVVEAAIDYQEASSNPVDAVSSPRNTEGRWHVTPELEKVWNTEL